MNDLESRLSDALHLAGPHSSGGLSGPALRRSARARTLRARTGGIAVLGATGAAIALVGPGLLPSRSTGPVVGGSGSATKPTPTTTPSARRTTTSGTPAKAVPVQAFVWRPAGALIDDPTILATAPRVSAHDTDWTGWAGGSRLELEGDTVSVVYADRVTQDTS